MKKILINRKNKLKEALKGDNASSKFCENRAEIDIEMLDGERKNLIAVIKLNS